MTPAQPWLTCPVEGPFMRSGEAAAYLNLSKLQFYSLARDGDLPRPFKIGKRAAGVPKSWIDSVIRARAVASLEAAQ